MTQLAYAVKDGVIINSSSVYAWAAQLDREMPDGEVYCYRDFDPASYWRVLQRASQNYGLPRSSAQMLPITFDQLPEVVQLAFMLTV